MVSFTNLIGFVLLILIILYFFSTDTGKYYLEIIKEFFKGLNLEKLLSVEHVKVGNASVEIILDSKNSMQSFNVEVKNSKISITTDSLKNFEVKEIPLKFSNKTVKVEINIDKGFIVWKDDGSLKVIGSVNSLKLDDFTFQSEKKFDLNFETYPKEFKIENFVSKELTFLNSFGNISTEKGFLKLKGDEVKVKVFSGEVSLINNYVKIKGFIYKLLINNKEADILV